MEPNKPPPPIVGENLVYREFFRMKFNKYQARCPHWDEDTVNKQVDKLWKRLDHNERVALKERYISKDYLDRTFDPKTKQEIITKKPQGWIKPPDDRPTLMKTIEWNPKDDPVIVYQDYYPGQPLKQELDQREKEKKKKKRVPSRIQHSFYRSSQSGEQSSSKNQHEEGYPKLTEVYKQKMQAKKLREKQREKKQKVQKVRTDLKGREYLNFYRKNYDKLASQHRKWRPSQINTIVQLLWKKDKLLKQKGSRLRKKSIKAGKGLRKRIRKHPITPYLMFKKKYLAKKGRKTTGYQALEAYKQLTFQYKHLLKKQAEAYNKEHLIIPPPPPQPKSKSKRPQDLQIGQYEVRRQPEPNNNQDPQRAQNPNKPPKLFSFMNKLMDQDKR